MRGFGRRSRRRILRLLVLMLRRGEGRGVGWGKVGWACGVE